MAGCFLAVLLVLDYRPNRSLEVPQNPRYPGLASSDHWLCYCQPTRHPDVAYRSLRSCYGTRQRCLDPAAVDLPVYHDH